MKNLGHTVLKQCNLVATKGRCVCVFRQRQATYSGVHHFKCPLCNNKEDFQMEMHTFGIYIPDQ